VTVGRICQRLVTGVHRCDGVLRAAQLMRSRHVGYLVVVESLPGGASRPVGVLTGRDIAVTVVAREVDPRTLCVGDIMTSAPVTVAENDSVENALEQMQQCGLRRLPVVNYRGELVGVVAADDALTVVAGNTFDIVNIFRNGRRPSTLANEHQAATSPDERRLEMSRRR
jgi:predicted transcriptional regulator